MTGNKILILGLGKTGWSCARYYHRLGWSVTVMDSRANPPCLDDLKKYSADIAVLTGQLDIDLALQAKHIVISPGIALSEPLVQQALHAQIDVIGDIEVFARQVSASVIAITGTNGKSTVTQWVADILCKAGRVAYTGGNFGKPALDLLDQPNPDAFVLELSSFQLHSTFSLKPKVACILNISPDHLDWHGSYQDYLQAKAKIYQHCEIAVVNVDQAELASNIPSQTRRLTFSVESAADFQLGEVAGQLALLQGQQLILPVSELRVRGRHNWANALAASAICTAMGVPMDPLRAALRDFTGLAHRCQWLGEFDGANWYNDSKGTNVGATVAAINSFAKPKGKVVLIAGGLAKQADFSPLAECAGTLRSVLLFGADAPLLEQSLAGCVWTRRVENLEQAVVQAKSLAERGDVVLFSPACASFDMFDNYRQRGACFASAVHRVFRDN